MTIEEIENLRQQLQSSCELLIKQIGPVNIGKKKQFPFGWRKAAKGRTVWRIVEEIITQNLEKHHESFGIDKVEPAEGEVTVYDMKCTYGGNPPIYINIKSAVVGGRKNKDDISKADGLSGFYQEDAERNFFIATFFIRFNPDMTIHIERVVIFPVAWIPDIYVNPSNNGNLQSAHYKNLGDAVRRTNSEFLPLFHDAVEVARGKRIAKQSGKPTA